MSGGSGERFEIARALDLQAAVLRCQRSALLYGATDLERSVIATIVSELGSNVLKYAGRGSVEMRRVRRGTAIDVEITVSDTGPGIADVALALTDHYSSGRTLGLGLPGVRRMSDELDIAVTPGGGATVRARKRLRGHAATDDPSLDRAALLAPTGARGAGRAGQALPVPSSAAPVRVRAARERWSAAAALRQRAGQRSGGDAVAIAERDALVLLAIVDATGHGRVASALAATLTERVRTAFATTPDPRDVTELLRDLHEASIGTVGAAAGLALLDTERSELSYLAVGNVRAATVGRRRFTGVARDGVLGRRWPTPFVQRTQLERGDLVALWTDGLPEALAREFGGDHGDIGDIGPLAELLVERHAKTHDDAACLLLRWRP
jgi:anti-sigma regulatory factor (Ser/Thr protein kinase)